MRHSAKEGEQLDGSSCERKDTKPDVLTMRGVKHWEGKSFEGERKDIQQDVRTTRHVVEMENCNRKGAQQDVLTMRELGQLERKNCQRNAKGASRCA